MDFAGSLLNVIVLVLSLTVHEFSHAWTAWKLGDDTAARMGRLTLNPIPHIDLFGTLLLPLLNAPIGWAKPVPVNPARFTRKISMEAGDILVSAAGPLSNLGLGLLSAVVYGLFLRFAPDVVARGSAGSALLIRLMIINAGLMLFNLLPVPPLDGGHVAASLMPTAWRPAWDRYAQVAPWILMALVVFGSGVLGTVLAAPRSLIIDAYNFLISAIA